MHDPEQVPTQCTQLPSWVHYPIEIGQLITILWFKGRTKNSKQDYGDTSQLGVLHF